MSAPTASTIGHRLAWVAGAAAGSLIAATFAMALIAVATSNQLSASLLFELPVAPIDGMLALVVLAFLGIELLRNGWQQSALRRTLTSDNASTRTDLVYCVISTTGLMTVITLLLTGGISKALEMVGDNGLRLCAGLPLYLAVPGVLLSQSFAMYWCHRLAHTPLFWPLHAVHHAADDFNVITVFRHHPVDGLLGGLAMPLVPTLLGFSSEAVLAGYLVLGAYTTYIHAELPSSPWVERWIAFGPHGHGIHHGKNASCFNTNFGDLVIWDRLFGTYEINIASLTYGCADPDGIYQSGHPLRDMLAVQMAWLHGLWRALTGRHAAAAAIPPA